MVEEAWCFQMVEKIFCPLTRESCRPDCAWRNEEYELTEDGVTNEGFCAMAIISGYLIAISEEEEE